MLRVNLRKRSNQAGNRIIYGLNEDGCDTYLSGWDLDTNLLDGFGELIWLNNAIIVKIEVLERFEQDLLLGLGTARFL